MADAPTPPAGGADLVEGPPGRRRSAWWALLAVVVFGLGAWAATVVTGEELEEAETSTLPAEPAPAFTLSEVRQGGGKISLSDFAG